MHSSQERSGSILRIRSKVFGRFLRAVDNPDVHRSFGRIESQAQLLLNGSKNGRSIRVDGLSVDHNGAVRRGRAIPYDVRSPGQFQIEETGQSGFIDDGATE